MRIEYFDARQLERIVRDVFKCKCGDMFGYINAGRFERQPFDAALIALAPLWKKAKRNEIDKISELLVYWERNLSSDKPDEDFKVQSYIDGLEKLVDTLTK